MILNTEDIAGVYISESLTYTTFVNFTMFQVSQLRILALKCGGHVLLAATCLLVVAVSTAALPMGLPERRKLYNEYYLSDAEYTEKE